MLLIRNTKRDYTEFIYPLKLHDYLRWGHWDTTGSSWCGGLLGR